MSEKCLYGSKLCYKCFRFGHTAAVCTEGNNTLYFDCSNYFINCISITSDKNEFVNKFKIELSLVDSAASHHAVNNSKVVSYILTLFTTNFSSVSY